MPVLCTPENMPASYMYTLLKVCQHYTLLKTSQHNLYVHYWKCASIMHYWKHARITYYWKCTSFKLLKTCLNYAQLKTCQHYTLLPASAQHYTSCTHTLSCLMYSQWYTADPWLQIQPNQPKLSGSHTSAAFGFLVELGKTTGVFFGSLTIVQLTTWLKLWQYTWQCWY